MEVNSKERLIYLDGLRGWAALVVVLSHLWPQWLVRENVAFDNGHEWIWWLITKTPLALVTNAEWAVYLFFVISGVALSYPILISSEPKETAKAMALFRYPRLTIPVLASCLIAYVLHLNGLFVNGIAGAMAKSPWLSKFYAFEPEFGDMLRFAFFDTYFAYPGSPASWNAVLWTMPIELLGSFCIFLLLPALPNRRWRISLAIVSTLLLFSFGYAIATFFVGYLIAEVTINVRARELLRPAGVLLILAAIAVHPWSGLQASFMVPAALFVLGVTLMSAAQQLLSARVSRFMGRISFPLYLVHLLVICSLSSAAYISIAPHLSYLATVVLISVLTIATSLTAALMFTIFVEEVSLPAIKRAVLGSRAGSDYTGAREHSKLQSIQVEPRDLPLALLRRLRGLSPKRLD